METRSPLVGQFIADPTSSALAAQLRPAAFNASSTGARSFTSFRPGTLIGAFDRRSPLLRHDAPQVRSQVGRSAGGADASPRRQAVWPPWRNTPIRLWAWRPTCRRKIYVPARRIVSRGARGPTGSGCGGIEPGQSSIETLSAPCRVRAGRHGLSHASDRGCSLKSVAHRLTKPRSDHLRGQRPCGAWRDRPKL